MNRLRQALEEHGHGPLLGIAIYSYNPLFLEMAARLGFRVIWIEMEHAFITFAEAADLCRMAKGTGLLTMIRIPNAQRENVAKAAECGPDIIDIPMVDSRETMYELIRNARFPPRGSAASSAFHAPLIMAWLKAWPMSSSGSTMNSA